MSRISEYRLETIPYERDCAALLCRLQSLPGLVALDSGLGQDRNGRYDIISALPSLLLTEVADQADMFARVQQALRQQRPERPPPDALNALPFSGGALGYFAYDGSANIGIYHWAIVVDHHQQHTTLFALPGCSSQTWEQVKACLTQDVRAPSEFTLAKAFESNFDAAQYAAAFERIQDYIHAGDCYQVNLAQRFASGYAGDPLSAYLRLRGSIHSPFAGFMRTASGAVLSFSPERFIQVRDTQVLTQPIKGTRPRSQDPVRDRALARELQDSAKDRGENLMIVDLLRNDLGTLCAIGSIKVEKLFELHSFTNVHHLVSSIRARLAPEHEALELLRNCFPGGSITGAPKRRAMEIIAELEPDARQVYCGSLGYMGFDGNLDSNIMIRTLLCTQGEIYCWGGGGIVADSVCDQEYQECFDKIDNIIKRL